MIGVAGGKWATGYAEQGERGGRGRFRIAISTGVEFRPAPHGVGEPLWRGAHLPVPDFVELRSGQIDQRILRREGIRKQKPAHPPASAVVKVAEGDAVRSHALDDEAVVRQFGLHPVDQLIAVGDPFPLDQAFRHGRDFFSEIPGRGDVVAEGLALLLQQPVRLRCHSAMSAV